MFAEKMLEQCKSAGVPIKKQQAEQFEEYCALLLKWNEKVNLTAIKEPEEVLTKHFIDSLLFLKAVNPKQGAKLIDVGTGAGFPGVPIKLLRPDIELTLLDGLNKRLVFLKELSEKLGFKADFVHKRAEEAGRMKEMRERFDLATARAVARMSTLCEYCIPLIKMKGCFVAMKGPGLEEELEEAENAMELLGCKLQSLNHFTLPDSEGSKRSIAVLQKIAFTPREYPRHGNKISKSPL